MQYELGVAKSLGSQWANILFIIFRKGSPFFTFTICSVEGGRSNLSLSFELSNQDFAKIPFNWEVLFQSSILTLDYGLPYLFPAQNKQSQPIKNHNPRHPVIFSDDDWGVQSPSKRIVFRFHYHSLKVIGSLGYCPYYPKYEVSL